MAEATEEALVDGAEPAKKKRSIPPLIMPLALALVGLGSGGFVGAKVVGPKLTAGMVKSLTIEDLNAHGGQKKTVAGDGEHAEGDVAEGEEGAKDGEHANAGR